MRDPQRIAKILSLIKELWELFPDWRLGQLIFNATNYRGDIFQLEDTDLENALVHYLLDFYMYKRGEV